MMVVDDGRGEMMDGGQRDNGWRGRMRGVVLGSKVEWCLCSKRLWVGFVVVGALLIGIAAPTGFVRAEDDDEDFGTTAVKSGPLDRARHRLYPGGRDEQDLTVQATLPQPSRSPDGSQSSGAGDAGVAPVSND